MPPRNSVERIPGGVDSQIRSIQKILTYVDSESPLVDELADWIDEKFSLDGDTRANRVISFLIDIEILSKSGNRLSPGSEGVRWLTQGGQRVYFDTLETRCVGFQELLVKISEEPATAEELRQYLSDTVDIDWDTNEQVTRRLNYLRSIGFVELDDSTYSLTEIGHDFFAGEIAQFQEPPELPEFIDILKQKEPPSVYLITQSISNFGNDNITVPKNNKNNISRQNLSSTALFIHLVNDEFRGYSRQSEFITTTTQSGTRYLRIPIEKVQFDTPVPIYEVLGELSKASSADRPDSYPFSTTGLSDISIGELGREAAQTILDSVETARTYGDAVPEYEFESPPTKDEINNLHYPGDGVLEEIIGQITQALFSGQHIVLVGPPGTGKSELAKQVADHLVDSNVTMVTATADWSSFDTIGGYQPEGQSGLNFSPGVFLDRFQDEDGNPTNEWLIVDELNRANVDKAFGSLFSALANDSVTTSFKDDDGNEIELVTKSESSNDPVVDHRYCVPRTWRLIATMNTHDKMSLFDLSYAFIRRFAFIHVGAPDEENITIEAIKSYLDRWDIVISSDKEKEAAGENVDILKDDWVEELKKYWVQLQPHRALGPAVIEKIARTLCETGVDLTRPTKMYVIPQLEDLPRQTQIGAIEALLYSDAELSLDKREIITFSEDYLGIDRGSLERDRT